MGKRLFSNGVVVDKAIVPCTIVVDIPDESDRRLFVVLAVFGTCIVLDDDRSCFFCNRICFLVSRSNSLDSIRSRFFSNRMLFFRS